MLLNVLRQVRRACAAHFGKATRSDDAPIDPTVRATLARADRALAAGAEAEAGAAYRAVLDRDAKSVDALCGLGVLAARAGQFGRALEFLRPAAALAPDRIDVLVGLGNVYRELDRLEESLACLEHASKTRPDSVEVRLSLARALREAGRPHDALRYALRAVELRPGRADLHLETGLALGDLSRFDEARSAIEQALKIDPAYPEAHLARAFDLLASGNFRSGWREYEWRLAAAGTADRDAKEPVAPTIEALEGKRVLITAEQGLGDQIMFASCIRELLQHVSSCALDCDSRLRELVQRSFSSIVVLPSSVSASGTSLPDDDFDIRLPIGSLPGLFRNDLDDFPMHTGYLVADPARQARWKRRLEALGPSPKIGLSWRGGLRQTRRDLRSIALDVLGRELCVGAELTFIDLQYGECAEETAAFEREHGVRIQRWPEALIDYDQTAALVSALDLVISVCTSIVHLAGALGRPVWVLAAAAPEWRYMRVRSSMPWYPSARIFRQADLGDWRAPVEAVKGALATRFAF